MSHLRRITTLLALALALALNLAPLVLAQDAIYVPRSEDQHISDQAQRTKVGQVEDAS